MEYYGAVASIVAAFFAAVALVLAYTGPLRRHPRRELSCGTLYRGVLLATARSIAPEVLMTYQGEKVTRLYALTFSLMNTGRVDILASEFEGTPRIVIDKAVRIFSAEVIRCSPGDLKPVTRIAGTTEVELDPLLLNAGDYITLRIIADCSVAGKAVLAARVVGIKQFSPLRAGRHPGYDVLGMLFFAVLFAGGIALTMASWNEEPKSAPFWFSLSFVALPGIALAATVRDAIRMKRSRWMGRNTEDLSTGIDL